MTSLPREAIEAQDFIVKTREALEVLATRPGPLTCIEKVTQMKGLVENALAEHVANARRAGCGWDAIAARLGVTRQAAWQRFHTEVDLAPRIDDFLHADEIWSILADRMQPGSWHELPELYAMVESRATLTPADLEPDAPRSNSPRWQRNVRNVLQRRKAVGDLTWDGRANYSLPLRVAHTSSSA